MIKPLWEIYWVLVDMVRDDHRKQGALFGTGHGFDHAMVVAQYCTLIAPPELVKASWVAAICHNTDHLWPQATDAEIEQTTRDYLGCGTDLPLAERVQILEAVLQHSKPPSPDENPVTVILKDADKLGNLGVQVLVRSGQFWPNLPMIDLRYLDPSQRPPGTTFQKPGSIWWDMQGVLEWEGDFKGIPWIRTEKARELAKPLFAEIRRITEGLVQPYRDLGLLPYPFPDDFDALKVL